MLAALVLVAATAASTAEVRALIEKDEPKAALEQARALAAASQDPDAIAALGEALYRAGLIEEAGDALAPLAAGEDAPARALAQLGLVRAAQGKDEALVLMERAVAAAPRDPWVAYRAASATKTRARASELLGIYLETAPSDDPDRLEGARGTIRLNTALGERRVWTPLVTPAHVELPLKPMVGTGSGHYIEIPLAPGKKVRLLIDTGSTGLFVVERVVKKAGFTPLSEETVFAGGGTGRARSTRGLLAKLTLGGLTFGDALITTTTDEFDPQGRIHGVLGISVFSGYQVTLDLKRGRLVLDREGGSLASGVPYWDVSGQMLVRASSQAIDGLFLFDTGATRTMLARTFADAVPGAQVTSAASVRTYGGHVAGASTVRGVKVRFLDLAGDGDPLYTSDLTQRSRLGGVEVSGFLGMDLLANTTIVIDTRARRVHVAAASR